MNHGTVAAYVAGCREVCCREAARKYAARRVHDAHNGRPRTVPADGTRRRVQALAVMGWPQRVIQERAGGVILQRALYGRRGERSLIYATTAAAIAQVYVELSDMPGPSRSAVVRAVRAGWAPPVAWDDDTIDDPQAEPYAAEVVGVDEVVVQRILAGQWRLRATRDERLEVARRFRERGGSLNDLERLTGWNPWRDARKAA